MKKYAIERIWPVSFENKTVSYTELQDGMSAALKDSGVQPVTFSHYGFVVEDLKDALQLLAGNVSPEWSRAPSVWAEAFGCHIARRTEEGCEFEIIQPVRDSFLKRHLDRFGAGVQHLSFEVSDIRRDLAALTTSGAELADPDVHKGLHGLVAFIRPAGFPRLCLELCEVTEHR